jgi:hypothetical protein
MIRLISIFVFLVGWGGASAAFLEPSLSPRSQALAGCGAAVALGGENLWRNPALLALAPRWELQASHRTWFGLEQLGQDEGVFAFSRRLRAGALGISQFSALDIYREQTLRAGGGLFLGRGLFTGASLEALRLELPGPFPVRWGFSSGFGLAWQVRQCLLGLDLRRLPALTRAPEEWGLETSASLGASIRYRPRHTFLIEAESREWETPRVKFAQETRLNQYLILRAGFRPENTRLTGGFEIRYRTLAFAYALQTHPQLGPSHTAGLRISADAP